MAAGDERRNDVLAEVVAALRVGGIAFERGDAVAGGQKLALHGVAGLLRELLRERGLALAKLLQALLGTLL